MDDRDIVAAILAGDPNGLAQAYDAYAGKLHAYCWTLLRDHDAAADAIQDTFIVASRCIDQLRDHSRLRPWLYAVARNECLRQLRARSRSAALEEAGDVSDPAAAEEVDRGLREGDLRELVWDAAKGLNTGEYEVLELNLRHELDGGDLAAALGVSRNHAHALLSRARGTFETSLSALIVARTGRQDCPELSAMLVGWDGVMTPLLRKRINRHIENCELCGERKRREVAPAMLLSTLPFMLAPAALRGKVLKLVGDPLQEPRCEKVAQRAEPFDHSGFPKPVGHKKLPPTRLAAAAILLVLLVLGALYTTKLLAPNTADAISASPPTTSATVAAVVSPPPPDTTTLSPSPTPSPSLSPSPSKSPTPKVVQTTPKVVVTTPTVKKTPSKSPTPTPSPGVLAADPNPVFFNYNDNDEIGPQTFSVTETGGTLAGLKVTVPSADDADFSNIAIAGNEVTLTPNPRTRNGTVVDLTVSATNAVSTTVIVNWPPT